MPTLHIDASGEVWPLKDAFTISRGSKTAAHVVVATVSNGHFLGRGEAVPYARYGETVDGVLDQIRAMSGSAGRHSDVGRLLSPGAALNALDCAFWDFEAKRSGRSVASLAGLPEPGEVVTAYTISLDSPGAMAAKAATVSNLPILKLKLGAAGDEDRMRAVRQARPDARLLVDANEAWTPELLVDLMVVAASCAIEVIEQPLPASADEALRSLPHSVPLCADESVHTVTDITRLRGLYDAVNVKLDKAGGLTGAMALVREARASGLQVMLGSMVATSLAVAPALLLASEADWVDLDGPLLLASDRDHALRIEEGRIAPPSGALWG